MRSIVRGLLLGSPAFELTSVLSSSALTLQIPQEPPFAVVRMGAVLPRSGAAYTQSMYLRVHDRPGDFGLIDRALRGARIALDVWGLTVQSLTLIRSEWTGDGNDEYDDGYHTIVREGRWELTGARE